jgi:nitronate monooxygenase
MTILQRRIGIPYPIFQAPTASIAGPELCAAVSAAGGLGAMGITWTEPEEAARNVREVRSRTDRPFQVNFALHFPPDALPAVLDAGAPVVTFSWGMPTPEMAGRVRDAGALLGIQVTSPDGARAALNHSPNFLVCQGIEAGGHVQSVTPLLDLLPTVIEAARGTPVVAAGGLTAGSDIARVLQWGAAAAMLGTRFVATRESRAHPEYKQALVAAGGESETALTVCFDAGWPYSPHRVLRNRTFTGWEAAGCPPVGQRPGEGEIIGHTATSEPIYRYEGMAPRSGMTGNVTEMCLYSGTGCGAIQDLPSAAELMARLIGEMEADNTATEEDLS